MKQGVLQFVLIKPLTAILAIFLETKGLYNEGQFHLKSGYLYIAIINNMSISISLYCLILFYMATEERLKPFNPFYKFLCIKAILFFSFWQSCLFTILSKFNIFDKETSNQIQSLIISIEMVFAAIAQSIAFDSSPFVDSQQKKSNMLRTIGYVLNVKDVLNDAHSTFIKDPNYWKNNEIQESQMEDIIKDKAFNWSDEDIA